MTMKVVLCACAAVALAGCNRGPVHAPVQGKVTYRGKPVAHARMMFVSSEGRPGYAVVDEQGHYEAYTIQPGDGVLVGEQAVTISPRDNIVPKKAPGKGEHEHSATQADPRSMWWPDKYRSVMTTPLKIHVEPNKTNLFDFELTD